MTEDSQVQPNTEQVPEAHKSPFYSNLSKYVEKTFPRMLHHTNDGVSPADQARKLLKNPSLSPEEVENSGVHSFLDRSDGAIYRSDLLNHINQNTPQLKDTVLQRKPLEWTQEQLPDSNTTVHNAGDYQVIPANFGDGSPATHAVRRTSDDHTWMRDSLSDAKELAQEEADTDPAKMPKWDGYALPGGSNYREILTQLPVKDQEWPEDYGKGFGQPDVETGTDSYGDYVHPHYPGRKNVLTHIRADERSTPEGQSALHVTELQSDPHQIGRKFGYNNTETDHPYENVPDMPFKRNWHQLALKRALYEAAKGNHDKLTFSTGDQLNNIMKNETKLDTLEYDPENRELVGYDNGNPVYRKNNVGRDFVRSKFGDDIHSQLFDNDSDDPDEPRYVDGLNIKTGGEGMRGFYGNIDQDTGEQTHGILGNWLNKYAKKWGQRVGKSQIETSEHDEPEQYQWAHSLDLTPEMKRDILENGQPLWGDRNILTKSLIELHWHKGLFGSRISTLSKSYVHGHFRTGADGSVSFVSPFVNKDMKHTSIKHLSGGTPMAISPEQDYEVNGVLAQSFKTWFGDWQYEPQDASQVVDNRHRPLVVYPLTIAPSPVGSGSSMVYQEQPNDPMDPKLVTRNSPLGVAFYFTSHKDQIKKAIGSEVPTTGLHMVSKLHRQSVFDAYRNIESDADGVHGDDPNMPELENLFHHTGDMRVLREANAFDPTFRKMIYHHADRLSRRALPVYLRLLQPFAIDAELPMQAFRKLVLPYPELADASHLALHRRVGPIGHDWAQHITGADIYTALEMLKRKSDFGKILRKAGYDGATYQAEGYGTIYVVFDPRQIKSVKNSGVFDINSMSIYKSSEVWPDYYEYPCSPVVITKTV